MSYEKVSKAISTRRPSTPEEVWEFVTREIAPTLSQLRNLFNAFMSALNDGVLQLGGITVTVRPVPPGAGDTPPDGSLWLNTTGDPGTTLFVRALGGWVAK